METFKWVVDTHLEIGQERPIKRHLILAMGGLLVSLLRLKDGNLLAVARGGDASIGERGMLEGMLSPDGGISWSRSFPVAASGPDNRNHATAQLSSGTILVAYAQGDSYVDGWWNEEKLREKGLTLYITSSKDGGSTWAEPRPLDGGSVEKRSPYGRMLELPDGTILMPVYHSGPEQDRSWTYRSRDAGETWGDATQIAQGFNETALLRLPSGKLIAMMRLDHRTGRATDPTKYRDSDTGKWVTGRSVWQSDSSDQGYTWSEPRQITGPEEHPADLLLLQSGKILLTYGHRIVPHGVRGMLSHDDGQTWDTQHKITFAADSADNGCGYPSSVQLDDGVICTAFCLKHSLAYERLGPHAALLRYQEEDILP